MALRPRPKFAEPMLSEYLDDLRKAGLPEEWLKI